MEFCTELDDGVYFAHLERQILMLMMDEEDESMPASPVALDDSVPPILRLQINSLASPTSFIGNSPSIITEHCKSLHAFSWKLTKGESSGTGVFIPQTPEKNTRKGKKGKIICANRIVSARASGKRKN